jgi:hypothetical protein
MNIEKLFESQREFGEMLDQFSGDEKRKTEITKAMLLSLHNEVGQLSNCVNFRHHYGGHHLDKTRMVFESVDVVRYILSILNTWDISSNEFIEAFTLRDKHLKLRQKLDQKKWCGQKVVIVDLDDVIVEFRNGFYRWLNDMGIHSDVNSNEYYNANDILRSGNNPSQLFDRFISEGRLLDLDPTSEMIDAISELHDRGYWVQLLTARPNENLMCLYTTYSWLEKSGLKFDALAFSPEKYRWLTEQEFFRHGKISFAVDDSPKHASEYARHGVLVLSPKKSYNEQLSNEDNIKIYNNPSEFLSIVSDLEEK